MRSVEIKNLAISIEALARVPGYKIDTIRERIEGLLDTLITQEENPTTVKPVPDKTFDDEIPF